MIRLLLSAALVGALAVPAPIAAKPPDLPDNPTITLTPQTAPLPAPALYQLRPTTRRTLVGSLLFSIHPLLGLLPTEKFLDAPCDHPQPLIIADDVLSDVPSESDSCSPDITRFYFGISQVSYDLNWWKWLLSHWTARQQPPPPEENDGYVRPIATGSDFAYQAANDPPASTNDAPSPPVVEVLPMPREESEVTCPYLRQQMLDRHACQLADPEIGRDVLDNLERLKQADGLLELAKELANDGYLAEAMECCDLAGELCPGSPCAERAADTMIELALGIVRPETDTEEAAEQQADAGDTEPGVEPMVCGLMKACHLLMSQGMHHQAAELARQAYALDPQRVQADPLIYKMHLLAESPPAGASEASEPPTCPYCPSAGKPIRAIVPEKKKSAAKPTTLLVPSLPPIDYQVVPALDCELTEANGDLRLSGDCSLAGNVYHLRYHRGCLAIWKTPDAGKSN